MIISIKFHLDDFNLILCCDFFCTILVLLETCLSGVRTDHKIVGLNCNGHKKIIVDREFTIDCAGEIRRNPNESDGSWFMIDKTG